jgi:hypothetical protein
MDFQALGPWDEPSITFMGHWQNFRDICHFLPAHIDPTLEDHWELSVLELTKRRRHG